MKVIFIKCAIAVIMAFPTVLISSCSSSLNLEEISVMELHNGYLNGSFTVEQVVKEYLERIERIDKNGPALNSIIAVNPDAIQIAKELDRELAKGKVRGPMHGIPVILKDNIDTYDKMPTTAGAIVLKNSIALRDSRVAELLREAGAVIIGKSNLSEWANFRASFSSSGWSGAGGQTKNPYVLDRNPCGSSSGSGVAVSANLCVIAIGTETNGSIVCPSNNNGIVGLKPTVGLVSRAGIIPISFSMDTPGPMGRSVEDVALSLAFMVGIDSCDSKTLTPDAVFHSDYTQFLNRDGLRGKRIGRLKNISGFHHRVDSLMDAAVRYMTSAGAEVVDINFPVPAPARAAAYQVMLFEFKEGINNYLASLGSDAPVKTLSEIIEFNLNEGTGLRYFDQEILIAANEKGSLQSDEYRELLSRMHTLTREQGIDKLMDSLNLDVLIAPTGSPAWKTDLTNGDNFKGSSSSYAAISGYPNISVPMGFIDNLPVGVSMFGRAWSEPILIETAYSFEQGTGHRRAPGFIKTR